MLDILTDGPFRYIHCAATGELIMTLATSPVWGFCEVGGEDEPVQRTLREWKAIARKRMGERLITDGDE